MVGGTATSPGIGKDVFFLTGASSLTDFWRDLLRRENVAEQSFVERAREAFPDLVFADSLTFRRFDGTYGEMRDWVVRVLSVVHDHFIDALAKHAGIPAASRPSWDTTVSTCLLRVPTPGPKPRS
ncbi:hypothetical protein STENM223S_11631 [Streptomyces tendae]